MQHADGQGWPQYVVPILVVGVVMALRFRRMNRARPLKLEWLWVVPAMYLLIVAGTLAAQPPTASGWGWAAGGLALGAALGWQRGKTMRIAIDPETHQLNQRASPLGLLFLLALIVVRQGMRLEGGAMHLDVVTLTDALLAFALGMFTTMRVEMYLRAKRLLREHVGGVSG